MTRLHAAMKLLVLLGLTCLAAGQAQAQAFQMGEKVQFNSCDPGQLPTRWRSGVVSGPARQTSGLVQMQVTETPSQDYPGGHGDWNPEVRCVRPLTTATAAATAVKPLGWFMGRWNLTIVAPTHDFIGRDKRAYRREEWGARMGFVTINADGTFVWQVVPSDPPSNWRRGQWRRASASEPGAQIVLLNGEMGKNWIVYGSSTGGHDQVNLNDTQFEAQRLGLRS